MAQWVRVCGVDEAPSEGNVCEAEAEGVVVCLARIQGELWALENACPHRDGPLGQGWIEGDTVVCPWHSWAFNVRSGASEYPANEKVAVYPVKVEESQVLIQIF